MAQIANNLDEFASTVLEGIINGMNNTEIGQEISKKLLIQKLQDNPDFSMKDWNDTKVKALTTLFIMCVIEIPELNEELKQHIFEDVKKRFEEE